MGSCARHQAGKAIEAIKDFKWRGGKLMIRRRIPEGANVEPCQPGSHRVTSRAFETIPSGPCDLSAAGTVRAGGRLRLQSALRLFAC